MATRCAVYCRISSDKEGKALGVERQRQDCLRLVERNGWILVPDGDQDTFTDNDISGAKDFSERKAFGRLVAAVQARKVDAVVAFTQARIYRDTAKFLEFCELLKTYGVEKLACVADADIDPSGSLFTATIIAAKDAEERRRIGELVGRKVQQLAGSGSYGGGHRPFGYQHDKESKTLVIDETEAVILREIADRVIEGESLRSITADLNARGIKPTRAAQWRRVTVREMLLRPLVTGLRQHQGEIVGEASWPGIIDRAKWQQVRDILTNPDRNVPAPSRSYPLRGIVKCGECDSFLTAAPRRGRNDTEPQRFYSCRKQSGGCGAIWVKAQPLEDHIFGIALPMADSPALKDAIAASEAGSDDERAKLLHENAEDAAMLSQLEDDYADRAVTRAMFLKQSQRIRDRIEARTAQIASIRGYSALDRLGGAVQANWSQMPADDQRMILSTLFKEIIVTRKGHTGGNRFDTNRVLMIGRWDAMGKITAASQSSHQASEPDAY